MASSSLTIGRLARHAGVNVETIRYYQRRGLVIEPSKPMYGFRCYPEEAVARVQFIKRAQRLGFTLREIMELLKLSDGRCADVRDYADAKCRKIAAQIEELAALHKALQKLAGDCRTKPLPRSNTCPIIAAFKAAEAQPWVAGLKAGPKIGQRAAARTLARSSDGSGAFSKGNVG